jgi:hypothetical protein
MDSSTNSKPNINTVDFSFLDSDDDKYCYIVLVVLNRPIVKELYLDLKNRVDYVICADGAANRMYDDLGSEK